MVSKSDVLFLVFCIVLNSLHIYQVCDEYFKYDVTTNVMLHLPETITMPSITFCIPPRHITNFSAFTNDDWITFNKSKGEWGGTPYHQRLHMEAFPTASDIFRLTKNISSFMIRAYVIQIMLPEDKRHYSKGHHFKVTDYDFPFNVNPPFIYFKDKCWTFDVHPLAPRKVHYDDIFLWDYPFGTLTNIIFDEDLEAIMISISNQGEMSTAMDLPTFILRGQFVEISYDTYESMRLPYPYKTQCRDYHRENYISKGHCKEDCIKSWYKTEKGFLPDRIRVLESEGNYSIRYTKTNEHVIKNCSVKCSQDECKSRFVIPRLKKIDKLERTFRITVPQNPSIITESQESIPLVTFLTNVFSTFGFWLGLSVMTSLPILRTYTKKVVAKNRISMRSIITLVLQKNRSTRDRIVRNRVYPAHQNVTL